MEQKQTKQIYSIDFAEMKNNPQKLEQFMKAFPNILRAVVNKLRVD